MGKYALILAFYYPRIMGASYEIQSLSSQLNDISMICKLCKSMGIQKENITIIADISPMKKIPSCIQECVLKTYPYPSDIFVCREICQFIENTTRGIEDSLYKNNHDKNEILLYISAHGENIQIDGTEKQGITLTSDDGLNLKYLLSKDIFRMIFGNFNVSSCGKMEIPIYSKVNIQRKVQSENSHYMIVEKVGIEEKITLLLSPTVPSPVNTPEHSNYRSSYNTMRGLDVNSRLLTIVDTCHSEHMTYFPYKYEPRSQRMIETNNFNFLIGTDLPYCVTISSCEEQKTTKSEKSGSSLTRILYMKLMDYQNKIDISQLHYLIFNSKNNIIDELIKNGSVYPIITSTSDDSSLEIPFFCFIEDYEDVEIIEK